MPRIFLSPPHMSGAERMFVEQAFASNYIAPVGPMVEAFEREFAAVAGLPHAVALSSGTAALHLALRGIGVGPGDTVFASTFTFVGSIAPVVQLGAQPVFIDSDAASWNLDPDLLTLALADAAASGRLPKAVVAVDLYGQSCAIDRIRAACAPYGMAVVEDAAEALGATYRGRPVGATAEAAVYSFNGNKIITTSGGGMLASADGRLIERARFLATQARDPAPHYEHSELGYNYRLSNLLAAIGRGQLQVLDARVAARRAVFEGYRRRLGDLPGLAFMPEIPGGCSTRWLTVITLDPSCTRTTPEAVCRALEAENIEARPVWKPMHLQAVFRDCRVWSAARGVETGREAVAQVAGGQRAEIRGQRSGNTSRTIRQSDGQRIAVPPGGVPAFGQRADRSGSGPHCGGGAAQLGDGRCVRICRKR